MLAEIFEGADGGTPSAVDQDVEPPEVLHHSLDKALCVLFPIHIRHDGEYPSARLLRHLCSDTLQQLLATGADGNIRALPRQPQGRGPANPLAASRDESDSPLQPEINVRSPLTPVRALPLCDVSSRLALCVA